MKQFFLRKINIRCYKVLKFSDKLAPILHDLKMDSLPISSKLFFVEKYKTVDNEE